MKICIIVLLLAFQIAAISKNQTQDQYSFDKDANNRQINQDIKIEPLVQIMPFSFNPIFEQLGPYEKSSYGQNGERKYNEQVRNSEFKFASLRGNYKLPIQNFNKENQWRIVRYENGKFAQHEDHRISPEHIGTQIIVFPKSKGFHQKGQLIIYNPQNKKQFIRVQAQDFVYTYVFFPLDFSHQVTEVSGTRIVAIREVEKRIIADEMFERPAIEDIQELEQIILFD